MSPKNNADILKRWADRLRTKTAVDAVRAGLNVFEAGLQHRSPAWGRTHRSRIVVTPTKASGGVVLETRRAWLACRATLHADGQRALDTMIDVLRRGV